jgi:LPS sulfotransferase NodH
MRKKTSAGKIESGMTDEPSHSAKPKDGPAGALPPQGAASSGAASSEKRKGEVAARLIVLISHERSGSHFLTDMLTSAADVGSVDEVCNFNAVNPQTSKASFLRFRYDRQIESPEFALKPDSETLTKLLDSYFDHLASFVKADRIWIDIKYGHVHNFEIGWWPSERRPFLLSYLQSRHIKIVHLTRKDALAAAISAYVGERTGVWHVKTETPEHSVPRIKIPPLKIAHDAIGLEREKDNFFAWLAENSCFHVEYEQLTSSEQMRNATMTDLCAFLGLQAGPDFPSTHRKVTPPLRETVENYDELLRVVGLFGGGHLRVGK